MISGNDTFRVLSKKNSKSKERVKIQDQIQVNINPDEIRNALKLILGMKKEDKDKRLLEARESIETLRGISAEFNALAENMGPEGAVFIAINQGMFQITDGIMLMATSTEEGIGRMAQGFAVAASIIASISAIMAKASEAKIANIDKEIAAEKKRDGKSKQSLAKVRALEAKKEKMEKKAFDNKKKMLIAQAIMSTAAAVMSTMETGGFWVSPLAMLVAAMGAAQVAIISGMTYQGGGAGDVGAGIPTNINIGEEEIE